MKTGTTDKTSKIDRHMFSVLAVLSLIGGAAILPYSFALFGNTPQALSLGRTEYLLVTFLQAFLLTVLSSFLGLILSTRTGLGSLDRPINGKRMMLAVSAGLLTGVVLIAMDLVMVEMLELEAVEGVVKPQWWRGLLAAFYGGVSEEISVRFFGMNLVLWLLSFVKRRNGQPGIWRPLVSIAAASFIFGLGHLGGAAAVMVLTPAAVFRTMLLNFIPGVVYGLLYWRWGLIYSMAAHFASDLVLHVIFSAIAG